MRRRGASLWIALAAALVLVSAGPVFAQKTLQVGVIRDPVNSRYATPGVEPYVTGVYEQLVFVTPDMELAPGLATSWERLGDNQWRFELRRGVKFHNGKDFNAQTAKFSLDWITEKIVWSKRLRIKRGEGRRRLHHRHLHLVRRSASCPASCPTAGP